jgi:hypothetical protein
MKIGNGKNRIQRQTVLLGYAMAWAIHWGLVAWLDFYKLSLPLSQSFFSNHQIPVYPVVTPLI